MVRHEVFRSNYIAPIGAYINKFEQAICDYTGTKNALAVTCGTAAIHLALRVLGIGKGDDVLVSTFTFIGSITPVLYQNANPVFIDSEKESWNLDPVLLKEYLENCEKKPKALIITHLYGQSAQIEEIASICKEYGVYLIEDAAESLGATYGDKHTGTFGDFGVYRDSLSVSDGVAEDLFKRGLCLPSGTEMTKEDVKRVGALIRSSVTPQLPLSSNK